MSLRFVSMVDSISTSKNGIQQKKKKKIWILTPTISYAHTQIVKAQLQYFLLQCKYSNLKAQKYKNIGLRIQVFCIGGEKPKTSNPPSFLDVDIKI